MSEKKPVWVDQDAHAILKEYSRVSRESMVDIASRLVLEKLHLLSPDSGLGETGGDAPVAPPPPPAAPVVAEARRPKPERAAPRRLERPPAPPRQRAPEPGEKNVRYLGGIWLV